MKSMILFGILIAMCLAAGCIGQQIDAAPSTGGIVTTSPLLPGAPGFSRSDSASINTMVAFHEIANDSGQGSAEYSAQLTLLDVLRGAAALEKIRHDYPSYLINIQSDREFMLARFKYELTDTSPPGFSRLVNRASFEIYRNGFDPDDNTYIIGASPDFYGRVKKGGVVDGWIAFTVPKAASGPLIVYGRSSDGSGGIWFTTS
jgi:hypothetical protein